MTGTSTIVFLTIVLPLVGGILSYFAAKEKRVVWIGTGTMFVALLSSLYLVYLISDGPFVYRFEWMPDFEMGWYVDRISAVLITLVCLISFLVHLFSANYMKSDPGIDRYYAKLGFFTFSMLGLLAADHLLLIFIFWELVGFSSYLLIGFWYKEEKNARASRIAFITNRVADAGFIIGILLLWTRSDTVFISELEFISTYQSWITVAGIGLLMGALGKSAQFPFFTWLPHAMAGPTPVSALIHAATMVAAGVYLLARVNILFTIPVMDLTALLGAITAFIGSVAALTQFDIKKVLAYSTISQLGYMVMAVGVGAHDMAIFHLWTHAFFKAGLFLSAGAVIHYLHAHDHGVDAQDMRTMGGLRHKIPVTFWAYTVCMLALAGLPLFTGFLSKDGILLNAMLWAGETDSSWGYLIPALGFFSALLTAFYMGRQWLLVFVGDYRGSREVPRVIEPLAVAIPLSILAAGSIGFIYSINPLGHHFAFLEFLFGEKHLEIPALVSTLTVSISIGLGILGLVTAYFRFRPGSKGHASELIADPEAGIKRISFNAFYFDWLYMEVIRPGAEYFASLIESIDKQLIDPFLNRLSVWTVVLSKVSDLIDKLFVDGLVNFSAWLMSQLGNLVRQLHSPRVQMQIAWLIIGVLLIFLWTNIV